MKATDFTLAWMQKFDFDGHPYKFSKVDVGRGEQIADSLFDGFKNYTSDMLAKVMVISSDLVVAYDGARITENIGEGEVVYMSTLIQNTVVRYFAKRACQVNSNFSALVDSERIGYIQRAGTFYIFDFNDNPA